MKLKTRFLLGLLFPGGILTICYLLSPDPIRSVLLQYDDPQEKITLKLTDAPRVTYSNNIQRHNSKDECKATTLTKILANFTTDSMLGKFNYTTDNNGIYRIILQKKESGLEHDVSKKQAPENISVIVIPHSINYPAYVFDYVESYAKAKRILNTAVEKLTKYPQMSFIWAETSLMSVWWAEQNSTVKQMMKRLVQNGQLEIVGGWVVPDEGTTHYHAILDQLITGHRWLAKNLGIQPHSNWAVGPTGHSATLSYLWKLSGITFSVISRVHEALRKYMGDEKRLEVTWRQFWDVGAKTDLQCHILPYIRSGLSTEGSCGPNPMVCNGFDFLHSDSITDTQSVDDPDFIVMAAALYEQYHHTAKLYKHNTALIPLGGQFRWQTSAEWDSHYKSYKKLFDYINSRKDWGISVKFGTLLDYHKLLRTRTDSHMHSPSSNPALPVFSGDFFPYSDKSNEYWSGLYTTRPQLKYLGRETEAAVRAANILHLYACVKRPHDSDLQKTCREHGHRLGLARKDLSHFQHHKAVSGVSNSRVSKVYEHKLISAYKIAENVSNWAAQIQLAKYVTSNVAMHPVQNLPYGVTAGNNSPQVLFKNQFNVVVFNPLPTWRNDTVTILVNTSDLVVSQNGSVIPSQILPAFNLDKEAIPTSYYITFCVRLPPLGIDTLRIHKPFDQSHRSSVSELTIKNAYKAFKTESIFKPRPHASFKEIVLENDCWKISFEGKFGMMREMLNKVSGKLSMLEIDFLRYTPYRSGAHVFQTQDNANPFMDADSTNVISSKGPVKSSITVLNSYFHHSVSLYNTTGVNCWAIHVENIALLTSAQNFELIMRIKSDLKHYGEFYTDANGFQMLKRTRRSRLPLGANTYPMTTMAFIQNRVRRLTVHSFQPLGVNSIRDGLIDVLLDRTMESFDKRGDHHQVMNSSSVSPSKFYLMMEAAGREVSDHTHVTYPSLLSHQLNDHLQNPLVVMQYPHQSKPLFLSSWKTVSQPLPCDLHLVSFRDLDSPKNHPLEAALVLHKRGTRCFNEESTLNCLTTQQHFKLKSFFSAVKKPDEISEYTISYGKKLRDSSLFEDIQMAQMDLKAFQFRWS